VSLKINKKLGRDNKETNKTMAKEKLLQNNRQGEK